MFHVPFAIERDWQLWVRTESSGLLYESTTQVSMLACMSTLLIFLRTFPQEAADFYVTRVTLLKDAELKVLS